MMNAGRAWARNGMRTARMHATSRMMLFVLGGLVACSGSPAARTVSDSANAQPGADAHAAHVQGLGADAPLDGMSVYQLESVWQDRTGTSRTLGELRGRPQAIAMVYTNCGSACPRIVADMKRLEAEFPELGLVLVSIDPERDSAEQLDEFARGARLGERWTLLSGPDENVAELAAVLGVRYRRVSETDFMHSNIITILDEGGTIAWRQDALGELDGTRRALQSLAHAGH